jgi:hypothetical protein
MSRDGREGSEVGAENTCSEVPQARQKIAPGQAFPSYSLMCLHGPIPHSMFDVRFLLFAICYLLFAVH